MTKVTEAYERAKSKIKGRLDGHLQHEGVKWMLSRELDETSKVRGGILADDMGLGKTMQAITLMRGNEMPTLIISIVGTVNQWRDALIDYGGYRPIIVNPSFSGILPNDVEVVVTTYSSFQKATPPNCLMAYPWKRVILDEGHTIRNPATRVFKEISRLSSDVRWILSGTPIQNSSKDLKTLAGYIGVTNFTSMEDVVRDMVLRRTQDEQAKQNPRLALPPLTTSVVRLQFGTEIERKFYDAVENYYTEKTETCFDAIESLTKCRQVCTNPVICLENGSRGKKPGKRHKGPMPLDFWESKDDIKSTKMDFLVKAIKEHAQLKKNNKCLVFCIWTAEMKLLQEYLKTINIPSLIYDGHLSRDNKESVLYNFKHADIPVLIIQITCGSSGLNLQCANKVFITSPHWNPCIELQAIGRAYRKGQTECVTCVRLVMTDTVEEKCMEIQERKMDIISEAMNDDSFLQRLGGTQSLEDEDIDIKAIFDRKKKPVAIEDEEEQDDFAKLLDAYLFPEDAAV